ncbi:D-beta-hydroxybutyrate dehydrogenase-like [Ptychodera flava]|uniref:D-beta-hydroxybutyrate dehydrogenase-like n=1 Tax=Ptychodera flava TaxID=63121 RepID=UPI00396A1812
MAFRKTGRVALITGATSPDGVGYAIAESLAGNGYSIILHGRRDAEEVEPLRAKLERKHQVKANYIRANLLKRSEIENLCREVKTIYPGGVDVLVNNAGLSHRAKLEDFPPAKWDELIAVNLTAPFDLTRLLFGDMKRKGWGRIINISSVRSKIVDADSSVPYAAAKHGLNGLTKVRFMHIVDSPYKYIKADAGQIFGLMKFSNTLLVYRLWGIISKPLEKANYPPSLFNENRKFHFPQ